MAGEQFSNQFPHEAATVSVGQADVCMLHSVKIINMFLLLMLLGVFHHLAGTESTVITG